MSTREYDVEAADLFLSCIINDPVLMPLYVDRLDNNDFPHLPQRLVWRALVSLFEDNIPLTIRKLILRAQAGVADGPSLVVEPVDREYVNQLPGLLLASGVSDTKKIEGFAQRLEKSSEKAILCEIKGKIKSLQREEGMILYRGDQYSDMSELEGVESKDVIGLFPLRPAEDGTPRTIIELRTGTQRVALLSIKCLAKVMGKGTHHVSDV